MKRLNYDKVDGGFMFSCIENFDKEELNGFIGHEEIVRLIEITQQEGLNFFIISRWENPNPEIETYWERDIDEMDDDMYNEKFWEV
jgi:hypothetical protein